MNQNNEINPADPAPARVSLWSMSLIAAIFLALYLAALVGWLRPVTDLTLIGRLEPILFLIFGYYFARLPAKHSERDRRAERERLERKLEAAARLREQIQAEREAVEEKIRNARVALRLGLIDLDAERRSKHGESSSATRAVETAINILNS